MENWSSILKVRAIQNGFSGSWGEKSPLGPQDAEEKEKEGGRNGKTILWDVMLETKRRLFRSTKKLKTVSYSEKLSFYDESKAKGKEACPHSKKPLCGVHLSMNGPKR